MTMATMVRGANAGGAWYPVVAETVPGNPVAGQLRLYGKPNQKSLFFRDSVGNEFELRPVEPVPSNSALYALTELYPLRQYMAETFR